MDKERLLLLSRENPRPLGLLNKGMSADLLSKPSSSSSAIIDKFRALLKERDEDLKISDDDIVPPPTTDEIVRLYEVVLSELTLNSKPLITDLTIIAGEQREHSEGIADAICARIMEAPVDQKLPSLYLLDSIVKNIDREYVRHFSTRLPEVFCEAYRQVNPNLHPAMRHLFGTWSTVLPQSVLRKIETQLQLSPHANRQSPQPTHGIHVNPKYLEARRQYEHSTVDSVGVSGDEPFPSSNTRIARPFSSSRVSVDRSLSPRVNEFPVGHSPRKVTGRVRVDEEASELRRRHWPDDTHRRLDTSAFNHNNGRDLQGPRALIDAYGNDRGQGLLNNKPLKVERLDLNGINHKVNPRTWKNTEEEEYEWEDMSPTLADRSQSNDLSSSCALPPRSFMAGPGLRPGRTVPLELDLQRNNWSSQPQLPLRGNSCQLDEDSVTMLGESWNTQKHHLPRPSQYSLEGRGLQFNNALRSGISSAASGKMPAVNDYIPDSDAQLHRLPTYSSGLESTNMEPPGLWPPANVNKSHALPSLPIFPQKQIRSQFDLTNAGNAVVNQGLQLDSVENRNLSLTRLPHLLRNQRAASVSSNNQSRHFQGLSKDPRENFMQSVAAPVPSHLAAPPLVHGYTSQGHGASMNTVMFNQIPHVQQTMSNSSLPPLPPGLPPVSSQLTPISQGPDINHQAPSAVFPSLISSLMAQGLISLAPQAAAQDSAGIEFNPDVLKIRHESAIRALYFDLPRQCKTCGLRFKSQEEHSTHMDWHVTRNRLSKNRKQKSSQKWFVNISMWLSSAEALGTDMVPGFLPTETVAEKKDDDELAVPADEDQNVCALCGEPFDDFYSDDTDEWMYRGAVYMNAPDGVKEGMDRLHLGPIVHAKCRSESSVVSPEDFAQDEGGNINIEDGGQRKRMRC